MLALLWSATSRFRWVLITILCCVLLIEVGFIAGNLLKLPDGGWVPLALGLLLFFIMAKYTQAICLPGAPNIPPENYIAQHADLIVRGLSLEKIL